MQEDINPTPLLLNIRNTAKTLSVCEKTVWSLTTPRGPLRCVKIGRRVLYDLRDLEEFIEEHKEDGAKDGRARPPPGG